MFYVPRPENPFEELLGPPRRRSPDFYGAPMPSSRRQTSPYVGDYFYRPAGFPFADADEDFDEYGPRYVVPPTQRQIQHAQELARQRALREQALREEEARRRHYFEALRRRQIEEEEEARQRYFDQLLARQQALQRAARHGEDNEDEEAHAPHPARQRRGAHRGAHGHQAHGHPHHRHAKHAAPAPAPPAAEPVARHAAAAPPPAEPARPAGEEREPPSPRAAEPAPVPASTSAPAPSPSPSPPPAPVDPAVLDRAAATLQSAYRAHRARLAARNARPRLAALRAVSAELDRLTFLHLRAALGEDDGAARLALDPATGAPVPGHQANRAYAQLEDALLKLLLRLDGVESGGSEAVREMRKSVVHKVNAVLERLDARREREWREARAAAEAEVKAMTAAAQAGAGEERAEEAEQSADGPADMDAEPVGTAPAPAPDAEGDADAMDAAGPEPAAEEHPAPPEEHPAPSEEPAAPHAEESPAPAAEEAPAAAPAEPAPTDAPMAEAHPAPPEPSSDAAMPDAAMPDAAAEDSAAPATGPATGPATPADEIDDADLDWVPPEEHRGPAPAFGRREPAGMGRGAGVGA